MSNEKELELGCEVRCMVTGYEGILMTIDTHFYGCTRGLIGKLGEQEWSKFYGAPLPTIERIGDGIIKEMPYMPKIEPRFKCGDKIETVLQTGGIVVTVSETLHGTTRYFVESMQESETTVEDAFITFEPLMKKVA